jgi:hypothetical protein
MINLSKDQTQKYCVTNYSVEKQPVKKSIMRKQFKQLFRGLAELAAVFTAVFVAPALLSALINFDISVYFSCIHNATYCVILSIFGVVISMFYTSMHQ